MTQCVKTGESTMAHVKIDIRFDSDTGEYRVRYFENGEYLEGPTYYTDDRRDARTTAKDMAQRAVDRGDEVYLRLD